MFKNKKNSIFIVSVLTIILMLAVGSYAYWTWKSEEDKNIVFNTSKQLQDYIIYDEGESKFVGDFKISSTYLDGVHTTISIYKTEEAKDIEMYATINMRINEIGENLKDFSGLKWTLTEGNATSNGEVLASGNFIGYKINDTIELKTNIEVLTELREYTVWLWLDESENPSSELTGESVDTSIWTQVNQLRDETFEITSINYAENELNVSVINKGAKITHYQFTTENIEPNEWIAIADEEIDYTYTLKYSESLTDKNYIWFKDENEKIISESVSVNLSYMVNFNGNIFSTSNQTLNGLTLTYDYENSYLTINGTPLYPTNIIDFLTDLTFKNGDKYEMTLDYISGSYSYTGTGSLLFGIDVVNSSNSSLSTRNTISQSYPTSGSLSNVLSISNLGVSEGSGFMYWIWADEPSNAVFTNYKMKVNITKVESKEILLNKEYGELPVPVRSGFKFDGWYTEENGNGTKITSDSVVSIDKDHTLYAKWVENIAPTITYISSGGMVYNDPTFASGVNSTNVYNNLGNGNVTVTRTAMTTPVGSYGLTIKTTGEASPGHGGFYFMTPTQANEILITKIIAKIPVGYNIAFGTNAIGDGAHAVWLTSLEGTGDWKEYIFYLRAGSSGTFSTTNFYYITGGSTATTSNPVTWQVAYATVYTNVNYSNIRSGISFFASDNESGIAAYGISQSETTQPNVWLTGNFGKTTGQVYENITSNGTYYIWVKDKANNISKQSVIVDKIDKDKPTGSVSASVSSNTITATLNNLSDNNGSGLSGTYGWKISTSNVCDATTTGFTNSTNSSYNFTVSSIGTYYVCAKVSDNVGNVSYIVSDKILNHMTLSASVPNGSTISKSHTATVTLSSLSGFSAGTYTIKYGTASPFYGPPASSACDNLSNSTNVSISAGTKSKSLSFTFNTGTQASNGYFMVCTASDIKDINGNTLASGTYAYDYMKLDNTKPTGIIHYSISNTYSSNVTISVEYGSPLFEIEHVAKYEYLVTTASTCPTSGYISSTNSSYTWSGLTNNQIYNICVRMTDVAGNVGDIISKQYANFNWGSPISNSQYLSQSVPSGTSILNETVYAFSWDSTLWKTYSVSNTGLFDQFALDFKLSNGYYRVCYSSGASYTGFMDDRLTFYNPYSSNSSQYVLTSTLDCSYLGYVSSSNQLRVTVPSSSSNTKWYIQKSTSK